MSIHAVMRLGDGHARATKPMPRHEGVGRRERKNILASGRGDGVRFDAGEQAMLGGAVGEVLR
jgi:hypothetical protein